MTAITSLSAAAPIVHPVPRQPGCTNPVPCQVAGFTYKSQYCQSCFDRHIAEYDARVEAQPNPHPIYFWTEYTSLSTSDRAEVRTARNEALAWATQERGADGCGLTQNEVIDAIRSAEADAIFQARQREVEGAEGSQPTITDHYDVSRVSEIEWSGFQLGLEGYAVAGSPEYTPEERKAFLRGHAAGFAEYEDTEYDRWVTEQEWLDSAYLTDADRAHQVERDRVNYSMFFDRSRQVMSGIVIDR